jgi:transcriptional regulator with XRE-family HTH domain
MANNSFITEFCKQTGLSQRNLAAFTGAHQSVLSRYESGSRNLPPEALVVLAKLYKKASSITKRTTAKAAVADKAAMKEEANWCRIQCLPLRKQLTAIKENYRQAATALLVLDSYIKEAGPFTGKKQRWLDEQHYQAEKKLAKNNFMVQQKLLVTINLLEHEATLWEKSMQQKK